MAQTTHPKIKPLGHRVLIKRTKAQTSKGGILLPETAKEKPRDGEVIAVGPGKTDDEGNLISLTLKVGDRVLFSSYSGTEVKDFDDENEYLIMSEDDVLGILN